MKFKYILILMVIISLISGSILMYDKVNAERSSNIAEIILSYDDIDEMVKQSDQDMEYWLKEFKKMSINTVSINEITLNSLIENNSFVDAKVFPELGENLSWLLLYPENAIEYLKSNSVDKDDVIIEIYEKSLFEFVMKRLSQIYPDEFYNGFIGEKLSIIVLDGTIEDSYYREDNVLTDFEGENVKRVEEINSSKLFDIGLGFDENKIEIVKNAGLDVNLRPGNYSRYAKEKLDYFLKYIEDNNLIPNYFIFSSEVVGYPNFTDELSKFMKSKNIMPALIESSVQRSNIEQSGLLPLVEDFDYETVRLFSVMNYIQNRFKFYNYNGAEEIENTLYRAITERNIRLVYFRPFKSDEKVYVTDVRYYQDTFESLSERLLKHNITLGKAVPMKFNNPNRILLTLTVFGALAVGLWLLLMLFKINSKYMYYLAIFLTLGILSFSYIIPNLSLILFSFAGAIVFSTTAIYYFIENINNAYKYKVQGSFKIIIMSSIILFSTLMISVFGGLYVNILLSHSKYLLEIEIFRGVLLSEILPLILFGIIYIIKFGYNNKIEELSEDKLYYKDLLKFFDINIKAKHIMYLSVLMGIGYVYISRAGHETSLKPSDYEMIFRNFLEYNIIARPRTKEFLIAFPSLMMALNFAYQGYKKFVFPFAFIGAIGYTSIINTFCHLRTPVYLSLYRVGYSVLFGIIIGAIGIVLMNIIIKLVKRVQI